MSDSLQPHRLQHARLHRPPLSARVCSNSYPLSWWCYLTITSSAAPFSFCLQTFPASGSFPMSWSSFTSGGQNIGASALASVFPMNIQGWFPLALAGLTSLQSKRFSRIFSSTTICKHQFFGAFKKFQRTQLSLWSNSHLYMATGKTIALTIWTFVGKVVSLLFNMLSKFVIAFLPSI